MNIITKVFKNFFNTTNTIDAEAMMYEMVIQIVAECKKISIELVTNESVLGEEYVTIQAMIASRMHFCFLDVNEHTTVGLLIAQILKPKPIPFFENDFEVRTA